MQNQGDHRENEQQVDQTSGDVEDCKAANPRYQQHNEQYCPNTHVVFSYGSREVNSAAVPARRAKHILPGASA
jgi:hypothetical protein